MTTTMEKRMKVRDRLNRVSGHLKGQICRHVLINGIPVNKNTASRIVNDMMSRCIGDGDRSYAKIRWREEGELTDEKIKGNMLDSEVSKFHEKCLYMLNFIDSTAKHGDISIEDYCMVLDIIFEAEEGTSYKRIDKNSLIDLPSLLGSEVLVLEPEHRYERYEVKPPAGKSGKRTHMRKKLPKKDIDGTESLCSYNGNVAECEIVTNHIKGCEDHICGDAVVWLILSGKNRGKCVSGWAVSCQVACGPGKTKRKSINGREMFRASGGSDYFYVNKIGSGEISEEAKLILSSGKVELIVGETINDDKSRWLDASMFSDEPALYSTPYGTEEAESFTPWSKVEWEKTQSMDVSGDIPATTNDIIYLQDGETCDAIEEGVEGKIAMIKQQELEIAVYIKECQDSIEETVKTMNKNIEEAKKEMDRLFREKVEILLSFERDVFSNNPGYIPTLG